ncbi:MAG: nitroreductase family protein [Cyanobacteria bacterium P01_G01_bin.49]
MRLLDFSLIKEKTSEFIVIKLREIRRSLRAKLVFIAAKNSWLSILYYCIFSRKFLRECQAVLQGKVQYHKSLQSDSQYLLKRNIHRLEKGLIMRPFRDVFAVGYIRETVENYKNFAQYCKGNEETKDELFWYFSVLDKYFGLTSSHPVIDEVKAVFRAIPAIKDAKILVPYKRYENETSSVSYSDFLELCKQRRSVRWYLQKPVPRELIDQAILAASLSPSACNRQPFEFRIFDKPELVGRIGSIPKGTNGFHQNFPAIAVVVGKLRAYFDERDRHVIYIDAALATMTFMYALETLSLSSCPINWPDVEQQEKEMANLLNLDIDERIVMLISIGFPDPEGLIPYSQKKSLNKIRRYNLA